MKFNAVSFSLVGMVMSLTPALAGKADVVISGGALDPVIVDADVYLATPEEAEAPSTLACRATKRYVELVNSGAYSEVVELFAEDAVVLEPGGRILQGKDDIRGFYEGSIGAMRPHVIAVDYVGDETDCMVELSVQREIQGELRYALVSIDHFTMGADGKFARMVAFARIPRAR